MDARTIITRAQRLANRVDVQYDDRCLQFLNEAVEAWALKQPWSTLRQTVDLVCDGSRDLIFPDYVRSVRWLTDLTNKNKIDARDFWDREQTNTYLNGTSGSPYWWREESVEPVYRQPSSPAQISVQTTQSDVFAVHVAGIARDTAYSGTAGYEYRDEEVLNVSGSNVQTTTKYFVKILSVGKNALTAADVQVRNGSDVIARIPARAYRSEYRRVELITIPGAGTQIRAGVIVAPPQLTLATHCPHPSINPEFLVWYVAGLIHVSQGKAELAAPLLQRAAEFLQDRAYQEKMAGDKDLSAIPDMEYWGREDLYSWPYN